MEGRVFIIGIGLIGGSLALCIKKEHPNAVLVGYDIHHEQARIAKMLTVCDETVESIEAGARDADLIIIAAPVMESEDILEILVKIELKEDVIITDAGSTKVAILEKAKALQEKGIVFIGGHPMAGSHKSGVTAAKTRLFENAFYILTPTAHYSETYVLRLQKWLAGTNAKFILMSPNEHDYLTGVISHFPHLIAASLVHNAESNSVNEALIPRLAAGGFRDITRIASSSPEMWRDIMLHNKDVLLQLLRDWQEEMSKVEGMLMTANGEEIYTYFKRAKAFRDDLPQKEKGAIPAFYDLYVDVPDYPGVISEVTGYLAKAEISITNIRILETRDDIFGVLVISFQTEADRAKAITCLKEETNYEMSIGS